MKHKLNQIIHADCMDVMRDIPDKYFELAIVDPPYGIGDFTHNKKERRYKGTIVTATKFNVYWNNKIPPKEYFMELKRISKDQIIWGANYYNCFKNGSAIVWYKSIKHPNMSQCEIASYSKGVRVNYVDIEWYSLNRTETTIHPCQKPVALYRWLLQNYAKPGDKIIDTHSGSGSCAIACHLEHHDFLAIEKDADYHAASVARLDEVRAQGRLF